MRDRRAQLRFVKPGHRAPRAPLSAYRGSTVCGTVSRMQFTEAELREYVTMWSEEFHEAISVEEARLSATALVDLFLLLAFSDGES